ncbi:MAG: hypothetical protein JW731_14225 [Bacteroidales bacterium]|nr:hypothetical protein [Bacteroidales bacterium]
MKKITLIILTLSISASIHLAQAQQDKQQSLSNEEIDAYKEQITNLLHYLEGTFNFLGDPASPQKEKEIIINESYLKTFKDDKVQIEDDLDEKRDVPLHKDVQAYLKDIEFFFKSVHFDFILVDISHYLNDGGSHYFKVTFNRNLDGITVEGDSVTSRKVRYMEINLDVANNDLRIASIYTTQLNEKEETRNWWNNLTAEWRKIFGENIAINDTVRLSDVVYLNDSLIIIGKLSNDPVDDTLKNYSIDLPEERLSGSNFPVAFDTLMINTQSIFNKLSGIKKLQKIDISDRTEVRSLSPLSELSDLKEVICKNTLVSDLSPIRNLNKLEVLDISETPVESLSPLHYSVSLNKLYFNYTLVNDLKTVAGLIKLSELEFAGNRINNLQSLSSLKELHSLDCSNTQVYDVSPLKDLKKLEKLNISGTTVSNLEPIAGLNELKYLNLENTTVMTLESLSEIKNIEILRISNTEISSLEPLNNLESLKKVYCDNTQIKNEDAIAFMRKNPECLIIFESEELLQGWKDLAEPWKLIARDYTELSDEPTREELHSLLKIQSLNISGNKSITTLNPVRRFYNLQKLNASSVDVEDYSPIGDAVELEELDLSHSSVKKLDFTKNLVRLEKLIIENTSISSLEPLKNLPDLSLVYADSTSIGEDQVFALRKNNPACLVIFKTEKLRTWWQNLPVAWKEYFSGQFKLDSPPSKEQLHKLFYQDSISIESNNQIRSLDPLAELSGLRSIRLVGTQITDLSPLGTLKYIKSLTIQQSPLTNLEPISGLSSLETINLENTPIENLDPLSNLQKLKYLNFSGTQVSDLKSLSALKNLEKIAFNNTSVKNIKYIFDLPKLKEVQCYNTKVNTKNIDKLKESKPGCEVIYY